MPRTLRLSALVFVVLPAVLPAAEEAAARGEAIFRQRCAGAPCHGDAGDGGRFRLKDRGLNRGVVLRAVREGLPNSTMPGFQDKLDAAALAEVTAYVVRLMQPPPKGERTHTASATASSPEALLFKSNCGFCHTEHGAGPWMDGLDKSAVLRGFATNRVKRVKTITLKDGETFPALIVMEDEKEMEAWDLTDSPPIKRSLEMAEIESITPAKSWSHPKVRNATVLSRIAEYVAAW